jgi:hypothetical protein
MNWLALLGRTRVSTRPRAEVVGEGGNGVRAEARAPAAGRRRAAWGEAAHTAGRRLGFGNSDS